MNARDAEVVDRLLASIELLCAVQHPDGRPCSALADVAMVVFCERRVERITHLLCFEHHAVMRRAVWLFTAMTGHEHRIVAEEPILRD